MLRTAVIGVGHLGQQHARIHAALSAENKIRLVSVCDLDTRRASEIAERYGLESTTDWQTLNGKVDAASLAVPTESHCEIACGLLEVGIHVLVEKPISRTIEEADRIIAAARSLDIDVVLDLMIHDLDIVQWLVGEDIEAISVHAVGIPILTNRVDAANARIEFATGAVANITASRVGTEKIRKMRFFQPQDYIVLDYATNHASISNLAPSTQSPWPGVRTQVLEVKDVEPLRAEIESFVEAAATGSRPIVSGEDGRRALSLALRTLEEIHQHTVKVGGDSLLQKA